MSPTPARLSALQLLLGAWLAVGAATWFAAAASFATSARVAEEPRVAERLPPDPERDAVLRYQAAETNRLAFSVSARVQLVLAGLAVLAAAWPPRVPALALLLTVKAAVITAALSLLVVPHALELGAQLALVPRPLPPELQAVKNSMDGAHSLYAALDLLRAALVLAAALVLGRQAGRAARVPAPAAAALGALLFLAPGCSGGAPPEEPPVKKPSAPAAKPAPARPKPPGPTAPVARAFDAARAWRHLEVIVAMGPRLDGFPGDDRFRAYLREQLEPLGWTVTEQPFTYQVPGQPKVYELANVSALLGPRDESTLMIGSHFDTRPWSDEERDPALRRRPVLGANDGGSGVAVMLEMGRVLAENPPERGVELLFFDGEDLGRPGHPEEYSQGAQHLVREWGPLTEGAPFPAAVVVIDMIADQDLAYYPEAASVQAFPDLTRRIWRTAERLGHGDVFRDGPARGIWDDHRPFLTAGVPSALIIDLEYPPWHTVNDTIDKCSPESMELTARVVLEALFADGAPALGHSR